MSGKIYLNSSIKFIPQKDFAVQQTENGGIEATQTFLCRYNSLGTSDLTPFNRGNRLDTLWPECPSIYRGLRVKTAVPNHHEASGIWEIKVVFTGTLFAWSTSGGSSGAEQTVPTYSIRGDLEEASISEHEKFKNLDDDSKLVLGRLLDGSATPDPSYTKAGGIDPEDGAWKYIQNGGDPITISGDAIKFAKMISHGKTTYKKPTYTYNIREESATGFSSAQFSKLGQITNPPGSPPTPSGYSWMLTGPSQEQSGEGRYFKDTTFTLIEDNDDNNFLYK
jgi:hypothetical protein